MKTGKEVSQFGYKYANCLLRATKAISSGAGKERAGLRSF